VNEDSGRLSTDELVDGRWEVQLLIGVGELAEVYDVVDQKTGGGAALKLFVPQYLQAGSAWSDFQQQAERVRALGVPALVNPYAFGVHVESAAPFAVSERVGLPALDQLVATVGTLLPAQFARVLRELAPLLGAAHRAGIVHRNLKPSNVFCGIQDPKGLRVSDFAVSALRRELSPYPGWGATPGWVAPEAIEPRAAPHPTMDVYAVGLLAFFALTDRSPFRTLENFEPERFAAELRAPLPPLSERARELGAKLDDKFDAWFARALALEPAARFASVDEMADELLELTLPARTGSTARWSPGGTLVMNDGEPKPSMRPASIHAPALSTDPGVAAASVQPLVFSDHLPHLLATGAAARVATTGADAETAAAEAAPVHVQPGAVRSSRRDGPPSSLGQAWSHAWATRPVLMAAMGTGAIAFASALVIAGVLISEGREQSIHSQPTPSAAPALEPAAVPPAESKAAAQSTTEPAPPAPEPATSGSAVAAEPVTTARVRFDCTPVACAEVHCDGLKFTDLESHVELPVGEHRCIGSAEGYLPLITTLEVEAGQELVHQLALKKKQEPQAERPATTRAKEPRAKQPRAERSNAKQAPCGTFINPCK